MRPPRNLFEGLPGSVHTAFAGFPTSVGARHLRDRHLLLVRRRLNSRRAGMSEHGPMESVPTPGAARGLSTPTSVRGVEIYNFHSVSDPRGDLTVGEFDRRFPFQPKRYFIV